MYFAPQTLKTGYGPGSARIVSAIRIFCVEGHSAIRCKGAPVGETHGTDFFKRAWNPDYPAKVAEILFS